MKRRTYTENNLVDFVLEGSDFTSKQARLLEEALERNPDDIRMRAQLLGYYFTRHHFRKDERKRRLVQVLWMVENVPKHSFLLHPFTIVMQGEDPEGYELYRARWLRNIDDHPKSAEVLANAAVAFLFDNLAEARILVLRAMELDSTSKAVQRAVRFLDHLEETRRSMSDET